MLILKTYFYGLMQQRSKLYISPVAGFISSNHQMFYDFDFSIDKESRPSKENKFPLMLTDFAENLECTFCSSENVAKPPSAAMFPLVLFIPRSSGIFMHYISVALFIHVLNAFLFCTFR